MTLDRHLQRLIRIGHLGFLASGSLVRLTICENLGGIAQTMILQRVDRRDYPHGLTGVVFEMSARLIYQKATLS